MGILTDGKREQENAEDLLNRLMEHMHGFSPSANGLKSRYMYPCLTLA